MLSTAVPTKIPVPFANSASGAYKRVIPNTSQIGIQLGAASWPDGFPPACFSEIAAGGSWPFGQDFNGLENLTTSWLRFLQTGTPVKYDAAFQAAIGGYPLGARVLSATIGGVIWQSNVENNLTNPDAAGAGWSVFWLADPNTAAMIIRATGAGGANILLMGEGATTPNKTIRANSGELQIVNSAYTAAVFRIKDSGDVVTSGGFAGTGDITTSGNITGTLVTGDTVNANHLGVFGPAQVVGATGTLSVAQSLTVGTSIGAGGAITNSAGDITAGSGLCRAAFGSNNFPADANACTIRGDFQFSNGAFGYIVFPSGFMFQWGQATYGGAHAGDFNMSFPTPFPHACFQVSITSYETVPGYVGMSSTNQFYFVAHQQHAGSDLGFMATGW